MKLHEARFALIHHTACGCGAYHYRVTEAGETITDAPESQRVQHAKSIEVALEGRFEDAVPSARQIDALKALLLELKQRYPNISIGAHRQVRGDQTTCPGRTFPMKELLAWSKIELIAARDAALESDVERQYRPE